MAAGPLGLALRVGRFRQLRQAEKKVALALGMARIGAGQPAGHRQPLLVARERAREVALRTKHVARLSEADGEVALALGMARIGAGQPAGNGEALLVARERASEVPLRM